MVQRRHPTLASAVSEIVFGALDRKYLNSLGSRQPSGRRTISQAAGPGRLFCFSITRSRANSYSRGPLAPSVTRCRLQALGSRPRATCATVLESGDVVVGWGR